MHKVNAITKSDRIFEIDFVRGILILIMCLEHFCYYVYRYCYVGIWDISKVSDGFYGFATQCNYFLYEWPYRQPLRAIGLGLFFIISGICCTFSRSNYKRGAKILLFFLGIYVAAFFTQNFIKYPMMLNFGVFLVYAFCMIALEPMKQLTHKMQGILVLILLAICILVLFLCPDFGVNPMRWFGLSQYINLQYLDDFALFPSMLLFALGIFLGGLLYKPKFGYLFSKQRIGYLNSFPLVTKIFKPVAWVGQHSLAIYAMQFVFLPLIFVAITLGF